MHNAANFERIFPRCAHKQPPNKYYFCLLYTNLHKKEIFSKKQKKAENSRDSMDRAQAAMPFVLHRADEIEHTNDKVDQKNDKG